MKWSEELYVMLYCAICIGVVVTGRHNKKHNDVSLLSDFSFISIGIKIPTSDSRCNSWWELKWRCVFSYFSGGVLARAVAVLVLQMFPGLNAACSLAWIPGGGSMKIWICSHKVCSCTKSTSAREERYFSKLNKCPRRMSAWLVEKLAEF